MGTVLKVIGGLTILGWIVMGVGCTMLSHALSSAGSSAFRDASDRAQIVRALQDGQIDSSTLPADLETAQEVTITLRDGTRRTLRNTPQERLLRAMLADKAREATASPYRASSSSYAPHGGTAAQPHFKPGEPMIDPNSSTASDDE